MWWRDNDGREEQVDLVYLPPVVSQKGITMASHIVSRTEHLLNLIRTLKAKYPNAVDPVTDLWDVLHPYWTSEEGKPGTGTLRTDTPDNIIETCITIATLNLRRLHLLSGNLDALTDDLPRSSALSIPRQNGKSAALQEIADTLASITGNNK